MRPQSYEYIYWPLAKPSDLSGFKELPEMIDIHYCTLSPSRFTVGYQNDRSGKCCHLRNVRSFVFSCPDLKIDSKPVSFILTWILIFVSFCHIPCPHLLYHPPFSLLVCFPSSKFLRLPLIWVEKCSTCGGPFEIRQHFWNCNIWVYIALMFFSLMDLSCGGFLVWRSPCCYHSGEFCKIPAILSWWWSLDLGWKILNNKKGSLTLAQLIYESCWALCNPSHPLLSFLKRPPNFVHASLGTLALNLPCMAFWLSLEGVSRFRNLTGF